MFNNSNSFQFIIIERLQMQNMILYCADECETTKCAYLQSSESFRGDLACEKCRLPFIYKGVKYENCTRKVKTFSEF